MAAASEIYLEDRKMEKYISTGFKYGDYLKKRKIVSQKLDKKGIQKFCNPIFDLTIKGSIEADFQNDVVRFGNPEDLDSKQMIDLGIALKALMPWRKGPWDYFGIEIDSEWRSNLKWDRIKPCCNLSDKKVLDIGCNNLYYMYRMIPLKPELIYGIDPVERYYFHYFLNEMISPQESLVFDLFSIEELTFFDDFFDTVFCLGILYHRRDPVNTLDRIYQIMKKNGEIILDCSAIPGDGSYFLFPEKTYMKAPGYWFLPTESALINIMARCGFRDITIIYNEKLSVNEQRKTEWAVYQSLDDFLDPDNDNLTVEGYPAPVRIYIKAKK